MLGACSKLSAHNLCLSTILDYLALLHIEEKQYFETDFLIEVTFPVLVTLMLLSRNVSSLNSD